VDGTVGESANILSLMITPVILILAGAALIGATTTRLDRVGATMHELAQSFEHHVELDPDHPAVRDEQIMLWTQIERASRRTRLLQGTTALLHIALTFFILTSIGLGIDATTQLNLALWPVIGGLFGAVLVLASALVLVYDAFIAMDVTREEARFTLRMTEYRAAQSRHKIERPPRRFVVPRP
jgi:hypothetical protein